MSTVKNFTSAAFLSILLVACGTSVKDEKGSLAEKKKNLEQLIGEQNTLNEKIRKLEEDISLLDSNAAAKAKLVSITSVVPQVFTHYIELRGKVDAENISYISPRGMGGQVKQLFIKKGDVVRKGQLILKLDDAVMLQQLSQLKTQLTFVKDIYQRRKNLWDQGIGAEVEFIKAKTDVESVEKQISTLTETWNTTSVYSDVSGVADEVNIRVGEFFQGSTPTGPQIKIVNTSSLKVVVEVPENYLTSIKKGTPVVVEIPDIQKTYQSNISLVGQLVNASSRAISAEAKIPTDALLKPNQLALVKIQDYTASNAIVIPMVILQTDEKGKYVYVVEMENGKKIARKKSVTVGSIYGEAIEIRSGLQSGSQLISQGYQGLYDGQLITTEG